MHTFTGTKAQEEIEFTPPGLHLLNNPQLSLQKKRRAQKIHKAQTALTKHLIRYFVIIILLLLFCVTLAAKSAKAKQVHRRGKKIRTFSREVGTPMNMQGDAGLLKERSAR